jgi:hypothetical protein
MLPSLSTSKASHHEIVGGNTLFIYHNIFGVLDSSDDSGSELDLLPGFLNVDVVSSVGTSVGNVSLHVIVERQGSNVGLQNIDNMKK